MAILHEAWNQQLPDYTTTSVSCKDRLHRSGIMSQAFLSKFGKVVRGVLSGFDRLLFRGTLRNLSYPLGLQNYLCKNSFNPF